MKTRNARYVFSALTLIFMILPTELRGTILAVGNNGAIQTFAQPVISKLFDRATGTLYLGLTPGAATYSITSFARLLNTSSSPIGTPLGSNISGMGVQFLARAALPTSTTPNIAGVPFATTAPGTDVFCMTNDGTTLVQTDTLNDASGAVGSNGQPTNGIVALEANNNFIFAAVEPSTGIFGSADSGLAALSITTAANSHGIPVPSALTQTAAVAGDSGIKAQKTDPTTSELIIGSDPAMFGTTATLFWDDPLQRLYMGFGMATNNATTPGDGVRSIVVASIDASGVISLYPIAPASAFAADVTTSIVGVTTSMSMTYTLIATHVAVMHATTGPSYLIVNGGNATATNTNNNVFALPLVDDPTNAAINGTLADYTQNLTNGKFTMAATVPAQLIQSTNPAAIVGTYQLPTAPTSSNLSDMVVIDDAVYVASSNPQSNVNECGIFVSHAQFDNTGRIINWTPWQRVFPFDPTVTTNSINTIPFFTVDAVTSNIWAVSGANNQSLFSTRFDRGNASTTSLPAVLQAALVNGAYAALELDYYTRGFDANTPYTYALFGGLNTVDFALTSSSRNAATSYAPHSITSDFTNPQNFLVTQLPDNPGCVACLEYSRTTTTQGASAGCTNDRLNFFFAGTGSGLYVFAQQDGSGFSPADLATLDQFPFDAGRWVKAPNIFGSVIALASLGNSLYVLVAQSSAQTPFNSILYRIPFNCTVAGMFDASAIFTLAQTGQGSFVNTLTFTGISLMNTTPSSNPLAREQLILATNRGLYGSSASQAASEQGIASATNNATALWQQITNNSLYTGITGLPTPIPSTVWPFHQQDIYANTYTRSSIEQCSGTFNTGLNQMLFGITPANFNSSNPTITTLPPLLAMWGDGGRRIFISKNKGVTPQRNSLLSWPYSAQIWNLTQPEQYILADPGLVTVSYFIWVQLLGSLGSVVSGTDTGVVALE